MRYAEIIDRLLERRGITTENREAFLNPSYDNHVHDPFLLLNMEKVVDRLEKAIVGNEKIVIYSDYDCDGIPGATVAVDFFRKLGIPVEFYPHTNHDDGAPSADAASSSWSGVRVYIPHRHDEGYGLHMDAVEGFVKNGVTLLITIDLGITAITETAYAQKNNLDVIITDHHEPHDELPPAFAILNPKQKGDKYPWKGLCGTGVFFKLVCAYIKKYGEARNIPLGSEKWMLDMVGLATLADMVPLQDENRVFAKFGLMVLRKTRRPGLVSLARAMRMDMTELTEDDVTFMIAPRLNAASRMESPQLAFELLSTTDTVRARALAEQLTAINDSRKTIVAGIMKHVHADMEKREVKDVIVVGNPEWRVGVLGLVAGKLLEQYDRPVFVWGKEGGDIIKGSCRGNGTVHVVDLMKEAGDIFLGYGGHEGAGGFSIDEQGILVLEEKLIGAYGKIKKEKGDTAEKFEEEATLDLVSKDFMSELLQLAPFGFENTKPIFKFSGITITDMVPFGKKKEHLTVHIEQNGQKRKAFSFFLTEDALPKHVSVGSMVTVLGSIDRSVFMGREEIRIRIIDIQ